jgi:hypothetical protein
VDWFLARFVRGRKARAPLVCYLRENGPIAYAADIFGADPRERADAMFAAELTWYWKTTRPGSIAREWTSLTRWSLAALLADLAVRDTGVEPRLLVIGVGDAGRDSRDEVTDARVAEWMRGFAAAADSPAHAVVVHGAPGGTLLFVAQQPPESVRALLQAWGISRDTAERKAYARLHGQSLEDLIRTLA